MISRSKIFDIIRDKDIFQDAGAQYIIVDDQLHVHSVNGKSVDAPDYLSPGDLLHCENSIHSLGCGTHENCKTCNLRNTVTMSILDNKKMDTDVSLLIEDDGEKDYHAVSTPFKDSGQKYSLVLLKDQTASKRELMMERIFFHDIINLSGALNGILDVIEHDNETDLIPLVKEISQNLMDEINAQKTLIYARNGILECNNSVIEAKKAIDYIKESLSYAAMAHKSVNLVTDCSLTDERIDIDKTLLQRVLHNMTKNAYEASQEGSTVTIGGHPTDRKVIFYVHNHGVIPESIKRNMFIHGNSSKGTGRGLGTYSIKLITEKYLNGSVWFNSNKDDGTTFYIAIPKTKQ